MHVHFFFLIMDQNNFVNIYNAESSILIAGNNNKNNILYKQRWRLFVV